MKCPKCGALTVVDPNHCCVRCLSCGWYERANEYNDMTRKPNPRVDGAADEQAKKEQGT
jgi:uncharacterized Zn finger protein